MKTQRGFTPVELIIIVAKLSILSVTLAQQVINFGSQARISKLHGLEASMNAGSALVYAHAAIAGIERERLQELEWNKTRVPTAFGYPHLTAGSSPEDTIAGWLLALKIAPNDWEYSYASAGELRIAAPGRNGDVRKGTLGSIVNCYVSYSPAPAVTSGPVITMVSTGC